MKRRTLLKLLAYTALLEKLGLRSAAAQPQLHPFKDIKLTAPNLQSPTTVDLPLSEFELLRPEDFLYLRFQFANLKFTRQGSTAQLIRIDPAKPAYIAVVFPPQNIAEWVYLESDADSEPLDTPGLVASRLAHDSRLVFRIPSSIQAIPYTLQDLLAWDRWIPNLAPAAAAVPAAAQQSSGGMSSGSTVSNLLEQSQGFTAANGTSTAEPGSPQTALEVPYGVILSPHIAARWTHEATGVLSAERVVLWHTRLQNERSRWLRAVDWRANELPEGLDTTMCPPNLAGQSECITPDCDFAAHSVVAKPDEIHPLLVKQTTGSQSDGGCTHAPVHARQFMLSGLGAWVDLHGAWPNCTISEWEHRAVMGRDMYVKFVGAGHLAPFGHRASVISIAERRFDPDSQHPQGAYLHRFCLLVVDQPVKDIKRRHIPYRRVEIKTTRTQKLDQNSGGNSGCNVIESFLPRVNGKDFLFQVVGLDWKGQEVEMFMPLAWIPLSNNPRQTTLDAANEFGSRWSQIPLRGQRVAYAQATVADQTTFGTDTMTFGINLIDQASLDEVYELGEPIFFPVMLQAGISLSAVSRLTGGAADAAVQYSNAYIDHGFANALTENPTEVVLELVNPLPVTFSANQTGGLATPNMNVRSISRKFGAVGVTGETLNNFANGKQPSNPGTFFKDFFPDALLLGGISLGNILVAEYGDQGQNIPKLKTYTDYDAGGQPVATHTLLEWAPGLDKYDSGYLIFEPGTLSLKVNQTTRHDNAPSSSLIQGTLNNFNLTLKVKLLDGNPVEVVSLNFKSLHFESKNGQKPDFSASLADPPIQFLGALNSVTRLLDALTKLADFQNSFADPPNLSITADGVAVGYSATLPQIPMGAFALQNVALATGLELPFGRKALNLWFKFADLSDPCTVTVCLFAGTGYFYIRLGTDGLERLDGRLEFGGNFVLNLGVASGRVYGFGGIYWSWQKDEPIVLAISYRNGGVMCVLGLVCLSIEFCLSLTYKHSEGTEPGTAIGSAKVTVEISIAFFSKSVGLTVTKEFGFGSHVVTFESLMSGDKALYFADKSLQQQGLPTSMHKNYWELYCDAFTRT
jgi:hypothetical protein